LKKGFILIIAGIIPLIFALYFFIFLNSDVRNSEFESAILLTEDSVLNIKEGDLVKLSGIISPKNQFRYNSYVIATKEIKVKQRDRSVWQTEEGYLGDILITSGTENREILIKIANDYVPCGQSVKIDSLAKDKKSRILGLGVNDPLTGYGKVISQSPLTVNLGNSPCSESLEEYTNSLNKKFPSYLMAILFLAVPSFFLIYLGLYSNKEESLRGTESNNS
jgi:hypothetical protein